MKWKWVIVTENKEIIQVYEWRNIFACCICEALKNYTGHWRLCRVVIGKKEVNVWDLYHSILFSVIYFTSLTWQFLDLILPFLTPYVFFIILVAFSSFSSWILFLYLLFSLFSSSPLYILFSFYSSIPIYVISLLTYSLFHFTVLFLFFFCLPLLFIF